MPSIVHVVTTGSFAGVEKYVCEVAVETATRGWEVTVVGGNPKQMASTLGDGVRWKPGATPLAALRSLRRLGRQDICHAHMTKAELIAIMTRHIHQAPVVSTRHFAAKRGASRAGRLLAPWVSGRLAREIAISEFVAQHLERRPDSVVISGVRLPQTLWQSESRVVLVLQRLEAEKDTTTALQAWEDSRLFEEGWSMRVVGDGSERPSLERLKESRSMSGVTFAGWSTNVDGELRRAGILLASAPAEPLGLSVLEAMAAGVPVVACAAGGHLETVGLLVDAPLFPPGDGAAAGVALRSLLSEWTRGRASQQGRNLVAERFTIERYVDRLLDEYRNAADGVRPNRMVGAREETR